MTEIFFENDVCSCEISDAVFEEEMCITITLIKPYNQLQIEQRNSVTIAIHESDLELQKHGLNEYDVEFNNIEEHITIIGWKGEE